MKKLLGILGILGMVLVVGCSDDDNGTNPTPVDQFETVRSAIDTYLSGATMAPTTTAQAVFDNLNDGNAANDPFVLSVRSAADDANGRIAGSTTINWRSIMDPTNLAALPTDRQIVVYCYTGHTGAVATTALCALGYNSVNMKFGLMSWTRDAAARVSQPFSEDVDAHDFPFETTVNAPATRYELPTLDVTGSSDAEEIIRAAAAAYVGDASIAPTVTAQAVFDNLNDGNSTNDWFILSVRSAADYAKGHVPGAINIPYKEIAKADNLKRLPTDRQIVVYCYTGHTAGVATAALRMMGYQAVNMKFGIGAWTRDANVRTVAAFNDEVDAHDFPIVTGQ